VNIISRCKKLYFSVSSSIGLVYRNLFLLGQLTLLWTVSTGGGIIILPLLSFFETKGGTTIWYLTHVALLVGLLGCEVFVCYLIIHIISIKTGSEIKRVKAEHKVRTHEEGDVFVPFYGKHGDKPPILARLLHAARKTKLLKKLPEDSNE
jgi:hypothetical protein